MRAQHRVSVPLALVASVFALVACGRPAQEPGSPGAAPQLNFDRPIPGGVPITDPSEADLAFTPNAPNGLGEARGIFATAADRGPRAVHEIAWVLDSEAAGRFLLAERIVDQRAWVSETEQLAAEEPGCITVPPDEETESDFGEGAGPRIECNYGRRSFVTLENGIRAFLLVGPDYTYIEWVESLRVTDPDSLRTSGFDPETAALKVTVVGPSADLSGQEAVEIVNLV